MEVKLSDSLEGILGRFAQDLNEYETVAMMEAIHMAKEHEEKVEKAMAKREQ